MPCQYGAQWYSRGTQALSALWSLACVDECAADISEPHAVRAIVQVARPALPPRPRAYMLACAHEHEHKRMWAPAYVRGPCVCTHAHAHA